MLRLICAASCAAERGGSAEGVQFPLPLFSNHVSNLDEMLMVTQNRSSNSTKGNRELR